MPEPLLRVAGLTYRYPGADAPALADVDLEVHRSELVLLAGSSGSGKSTLLRAAAGLVPHFHGGHLAGRVVVGGLDTRSSGPAEVASVAASVFQDPESQVVMSTVRAELLLPLESAGRSPKAAARAIEETALSLGIAALLDRPVETLSGGELQRVALASALVTQPRLLLLDEPTSQLAPVAGDELIWQLRRMNEEWGTTVVLAEQRLERCLGAADRVVALAGGRLACDADPAGFVEWAAAAAPELAPPASRMFALAGLRPLPVGVKDARSQLDSAGLGSSEEDEEAPPDGGRDAPRRRLRRSRRSPPGALELDRVWVEYDDGTGGGLAALRGLSLKVEAGESLALLGRNGAGKSTLLRVAAGLRAPDRGAVRAAGEVCLVVQDPAAFFLHDSARGELPPAFADAALEDVGLAPKAESNPRDLSGGERQRLALAIVLAGRGIGGGSPPAVIALDEPTRGIDGGQKLALAERLRKLATAGAAVIVATHDVEFAAQLADRCVLLGEGRIVADGPAREVLSGGRYFATEVARVLAPAFAVLPAEGARLIAARRSPIEGKAAAPPVEAGS